MKYAISIDTFHLQLNGKMCGVGPKINGWSKANWSRFKNDLLEQDVILEEVSESREKGFFHRHFLVHYKCREFAVLHYLSNKKKRYSIPGTSILEIKNAVLYSRDSNLVIKRVINAIGLEIHKIHKLDIAVDGYGIIATANSIFNRNVKWSTVNHKCALGVKMEFPRGGKDSKETKQAVGREAISFKLGKEKTNKSFTIYRKGTQDELVSKPYFVNHYKANGLLPEKVDRLELRCWKNINDFSLNPDDWTVEYISNYFRMKSECNLTFKIYSDSPPRVISLLNFESFPHKTALVSTIGKRKTNELRHLKTTLRFLFREMENFGADFTACKESYNAIIKHYNFYPYQFELEEKWRQELKAINKKEEKKRNK